MKPFLGIDLTADKKNDQPNGAVFLAAQPSSALTQALEHSSKNAEATIKQSRLPLPLRIVQWICGALGGLIAIGILRALGNVTIVEAYHNASWLFWIGGGCLVIWMILKLLSIGKEKAVLGTEESTHTLSRLENTCDAIYSELSVPANAREVDILSFYYKMKGEEIKVCEKGMQTAAYLNPVYRVFADSENLYIANLEGKYSFPLTRIKGIRTVKKHIRIAGWNKDDSFNKGFFKQFKLTTDNYGCIHCKYYHILEIDQNGESWGIYFPCYELPVFEILTGRKAE